MVAAVMESESDADMIHAVDARWVRRGAGVRMMRVRAGASDGFASADYLESVRLPHEDTSHV